MLGMVIEKYLGSAKSHDNFHVQDLRFQRKCFLLLKSQDLQVPMKFFSSSDPRSIGSVGNIARAVPVE